MEALAILLLKSVKSSMSKGMTTERSSCSEGLPRWLGFSFIVSYGRRKGGCLRTIWMSFLVALGGETSRVSLETRTRRLRLDQTNTELSVFYRKYVSFKKIKHKYLRDKSNHFEGFFKPTKEQIYSM